MSAHDALWLALLNVSIFAIGASVVELLFAGQTLRRSERLALGYAVGFALVGIAVAHLALIDVSVGPRGLLLAAAVLVAAALAPHVRRRESFRVHLRLGRADGLLFAGIAAICAAALVGSLRLPLNEWDGWAIWASRARSLYDLGGVHGAPFTSSAYSPTHLDYPLVMPSLEALVFRSLGRFDGKLVHVELVGLLLAFMLALWALLRGRAQATVVALTVLSIGASPIVLARLSSNYADVPLAFFVSLGLVALVLAIEAGSGRLLCVAALFLAAASLMKNEGMVFAGLALVSGWLVFPAARRRLPLVAVAVALVVLPWRVFLAVHGISNGDFRVTNLVSASYLSDHADRALPAVGGLAHASLLDWEALPILALLSVVVALVRGLRRRGAFVLTWAGMSFAALAAIYVISRLPIHVHIEQSAARIVASLVIGATSISPLLVSARR
jgi:hypothetical protein